MAGRGGEDQRLWQIAFGRTLPNVAALAERGYAIGERVYKVRFDETAICSREKKASGKKSFESVITL